MPGPWPLVVEMLEQLGAGRASSVELTQGCLARIQAGNDRVHALVLVDQEGALEAAREADRLRALGGELPPLLGVPVTVKDTYETKGLRSTAGAPMYAQHVPTQDAHAVRLLRQAGAVLLGKTNTPPLAADVQTRGPLFPAACNPWDLSRTSGGSTGGGAVAVSTGMSPLELGSDHGGSIRIPAHFCGVMAIKPSEHAVPLQGHLHGTPGQEHQPRRVICPGLMARSAADLLRVLPLLTPTADSTGPHTPLLPPLEHPPEAGTLKLRWASSVGSLPLDAASREVLGAAVDRVRGAGARLEPRELEPSAWEQAWSAWWVILNGEQWAPWASVARAASAVRGVRVHRAVQRAAEEAFLQALGLRKALAERVDGLLKDVDAWLLPVSTVPAFPHQEPRLPVPVNGQPVDYWLAAAGATSLLSLTGHPVVVLPCGRTAGGLPVGMQLVGKRGEDLRLLQVALALEPVLGGFVPPPEFV